MPTDFPIGPVSSAIFRVARAHKALAGQLLREAGLRPGQELVLMSLWQQGPQRQVDLVERLDSDAPTMVRSIARLEKIGLVRKVPSEADRRATIVHPTAKSMELRARIEDSWAELERATVGSMSAARRAALIAHLAEVEANLAASPASQS